MRNHRVSAARQATETEARQLLERLGEPEPLGDPLEELLRLGAEVRAYQQVLRERLTELSEWSKDDVALIDRERAVVKLYGDALDRSHRVLTDLARLGLDERLVRVRERQAAVIVAAVVKVLALPALGLPADRQELARALLAGELIPNGVSKPLAPAVDVASDQVVPSEHRSGNSSAGGVAVTEDALLSTVARLLEEHDRDPRLPWHDDPAGFARDCIEWPAGAELTGYQAKILEAMASEHRVAVRSLHGAGKTAVSAIAVLWFAITRDAAGVDWKAVTTAGGWRQLERYLWPEIHLWERRIRWDVVGRAPFDPRSELLGVTLKLAHGQAFAAASDDPQLLEGAHAKAVLLVLDESKSISAEVFDAVEGAMSGTGEAFAIAASTPGAPVGRFFEIHQRKPGLDYWQTFHVTLADAVEAGQVSADWAEQRAAQWGETSAVYLNRVLGEFASSDEDGVIPLAWVEAAIERHQAWLEAGSPDVDGRTVVGVDVARSGTDKTVLAVRRGHVLEYLERHRLDDTMATTGHVAKLRTRSPLAVVDVIGIGAGVVDRLREQHFSVVAFNASERATGRDKTGELDFLNRRSQGWWHLRELLDPAMGATIALPDDDELIGDLCAPRYAYNSAGKVQIEAKDEIRKRLGRSPDAGDAVVMAFSVWGGVSTGANGRVIPWAASGDWFKRHRQPAMSGSIFQPDPSWGSGPLFGPEPEPFEAPDLPRVGPW